MPGSDDPNTITVIINEGRITQHRDDWVTVRDAINAALTLRPIGKHTLPADLQPILDTVYKLESEWFDKFAAAPDEIAVHPDDFEWDATQLIGYRVRRDSSVPKGSITFRRVTRTITFAESRPFR